MNDNKLIAEFMGFTKDSKELYLIDDYTLRSEDEYQATYVDEMKFHTSWDWLMPVVEKCFVKQEEVSDDLSFKLRGRDGTITIVSTSETFIVEPQGVAKGTLFIELKQSDLSGDKNELMIDVYSNGELIENTSVSFLGPRSFN